MITGANGFVGSHLVRVLDQQGFALRACIRSLGALVSQSPSNCIVGDIGPETDWTVALDGIKTVIHTAARQHVMRETKERPLELFRHTNVLGSLNLARQAASAGVQRFVFVSSIKVNGEATALGRPFTAEDDPAPLDPYGITKLETERALLALAQETGMEVVIVRPPLVYGPNVKGNFASIIKAVRKGVPLPFASVDTNRRSMVSIENLVSLLITCLSHPKAANQIFLVCDGEDVSTATLLRRLGVAMGTSARLFPVPSTLLNLAATAIGRRDIAQRLLGNLQVDDKKTRELLNWNPSQSLDEALGETCSSIMLS